jgi:hypothetical protein
MSIKVSDLVKTIEVLTRLEKSSMKMLEDPRYVGTLQGDAVIALIGLRLALSNLEVEIKE